MRKYLILAIVALGCMVMASFAQAGQTLDASIKPAKLDKKKKKPVKLLIDIRTGDNISSPVNADQPPDADRTIVEFPKNLSFNTKAAPNCKGTQAALQSTSTDAAISICGKKSIVSRGGDVQVDNATRTVTSPTGAFVTIDNDPANPGSTQTLVAVQVTAFNADKKNMLYLHSRPLTLPVTNVLIGKLKKAKGKFGKKLDVTIPQLLAGGISDFKVTVKKGKYVQAVCKSRKMPYRASTAYSDAPNTKANFEGKCKRNKKNKK